MMKSELKKNIKVWCWWKSRNLYYTGQIINGEYKFVDICDCVTMINEEQLTKLKIK